MNFEYMDLSEDKKKLLKTLQPGSVEYDLLNRVDTRINNKDNMYWFGSNARDWEGTHYFSVGISAVQVINACLKNVPGLKINSILDMPCGSGRVLRFLKLMFPEAKLTAMELEQSMVNYCSQNFGAKGILSSKNLNSITLMNTFDLSFCGSLLTHLPEPEFTDLLHFFDRHMHRGSVLIFSTSGSETHRRILEPDYLKTLSEADKVTLIKGYEDTGFGYADYTGVKGYGNTLVTPAWMRNKLKEFPGWKEIYFIEQGWDKHQDVYGIIKES